MVNVNITESAQDYLAGLLEKQNCEGIGIRMFVSDPGTPKAETCIAYSRPGEHNEDDIIVEYSKFNGYYEQRSIPFLDDAVVDFSEDKFGGQLTIRAPNSRLPNINDDSPIEDKVNYLLYNEINPVLLLTVEMSLNLKWMRDLLCLSLVEVARDAPRLTLLSERVLRRL